MSPTPDGLRGLAGHENALEEVPGHAPRWLFMAVVRLVSAYEYLRQRW